MKAPADSLAPLAHNPAAPRRRRGPAPLAVLCVVLVGSLVSWNASRVYGAAERERRDAEIRRQSESRIGAFRRAMDEHRNFLRQVAAFYDASERVTPAGFAAFTGPLLPANPGVVAVAFLPAPGEGEPIVRPEERRAGILGSAAAREACERSRSTGTDAAVGTDDAPVYALARPVCRTPAGGTPAREGGREDVAGHLVMLLDLAAVDRLAAPRVGGAVPGLKVADHTDPASPRAVLPGHPGGSGPPIAEVAGLCRDAEFGGRVLRLQARVDRGSLPGSSAFDTWAALLGGLLLTALAAGLLWELARSRALVRLTRSQAERIGRAEARFRRLVDDAVFGILRSTPEGRILDANGALASMLGCERPEEVLALDLDRDVYAEPADRRAVLAEYEAGARDRAFEVRWRRRDGSPFWVRMYGRAFRNGDGRIESFETMVEDVTERKHLEEAVRRAQRVEAIGRLAGGVAHDFNNLLTVILGHCRTLAMQEDLARPVREKVAEIGACGERAAEMTRHLLAFGRQQVLEPRVMAVNDVVRDSERLLRRLIGEDVELRTALRPEAGRIRVDPTQMGQILMNIALNARDAMPGGGVLSILTRNVVLREGERIGEMARPGEFVQISIRDTGQGMDEETRARIFEPYFTTKADRGGTGLGLATVYGVVKQSDGYIWVTSEPGRGTTFDIYFPLAREEESGPASSPPAPARTTGNETVLIAEDEPAVLELTSDALREKGYQVITARNGVEALEIFEARFQEIDALVTDMVMPGMGGADLARAVRRTRPDLGILCMSGYSHLAVESGGAPCDRVRYIQKPFDLDELASKLREALDVA